MRDLALTREQIEALIENRSVTERAPWHSEDADLVDGFYRELTDKVIAETRTLARVDFNHYGSGYSSFIEAWFYRPEPGFMPADYLRYQKMQQGEYWNGLAVLLCRLEPVYVMLQGAKNWSARGGGSFLPSLDGIDRFESRGVISLAEEIEPFLETAGLRRLHQPELDHPLPDGLSVVTNLTQGSQSIFDAFFHWDD